jgi:hypothetical protein
MTIQQIQKLREKRPSEPFRVIAADGSRYDVRHPENLERVRHFAMIRGYCGNGKEALSQRCHG